MFVSVIPVVIVVAVVVIVTTASVSVVIIIVSGIPVVFVAGWLFAVSRSWSVVCRTIIGRFTVAIFSVGRSIVVCRGSVIATSVISGRTFFLLFLNRVEAGNAVLTEDVLCIAFRRLRFRIGFQCDRLTSFLIHIDHIESTID